MTKLLDEEISESSYKEVDMKRQGRVRMDSKGRLSLGKYVNSQLPIDFNIEVGEHGEIVLVPLASIPKREAWIYENPKTLESIRKGIKEAGEGKLISRGSFEKYLDDEI